MDPASHAEAVERMNAALTHRGPDDQGTIICANVCLGNTRLAVIDTSLAGHQPMNDPETGNWITYNGETYNFKQLRAELDTDSQPWRSSSDTEVVLRAYRRWGVDAFRRLRGMFAVGLWDEGKRALLLARDPLGIKPLYYYRTEQWLVFASEVRALLASGLVPRKLSSDGLDSYLATGSVEAPLKPSSLTASKLIGCAPSWKSPSGCTLSATCRWVCFSPAGSTPARWSL